MRKNFLRHERALQLSRIEAGRAEVLRKQDRENRIREAGTIWLTPPNIFRPRIQPQPRICQMTIVQNFPSTTTAQVVQPATLSLAVLEGSFYTPASSPTHLNSTAAVQSAESNAAIRPPPAAKNNKNAKKPGVLRVEPKEEGKDYCEPSWF